MLPKLPEGVFTILCTLFRNDYRTWRKNQKVKVSDVSEVLNLPRPGVTRTINAMEEKGYLKKKQLNMMDVSLMWPLQKKEKWFLKNTIKIIFKN